MMLKKMILLICMMFCANFALASEAPVVLTDSQNKVYQGLVAKFKVNQLTAEDNTVDNIAILTQQEAFLSQAVKAQVTKKQSLLPYVLVVSFDPVVSMIGKAGDALKSYENYLNRDRDYWDQYNVFGYVGSWLYEPMYLPSRINEALGLPRGTVSTLVYTVAPAIAFYGMYKMYSSLKNQQQELETVREILATLKSFGQPS